MISLSIGLEFINNLFMDIKQAALMQYTLTGIKSLSVVFFLVNLIRCYYQNSTTRDGHTWGLSPQDLVKNFAVVLLAIFSIEILEYFDGILLAMEQEYSAMAPDLLPLQMQKIPVQEDSSLLDATAMAMILLYEALVSPLFIFNVIAFVISLFLWILDLFIYPLFLAERYFLLAVMQIFFPIIISLSVFEKFRSMAYNFFKLYAGVYMLVPAFFLVNVFINAIYTEMTINFWNDLFSPGLSKPVFAPIIELGTIGFIVFLKFKLYKKASSFTLKLFTA